MEDAKSERFVRIAKLIEDDPEWFQDEGVDDADLIDALMTAAAALRSIGK